MQVLERFELFTVSSSDPALVDFHFFNGGPDCGPRLLSSRNYLRSGKYKPEIALISQLYRIRVLDSGDAFGPVVGPAICSVWQLTRQSQRELDKLPPLKDRGQTDRVTTPTQVNI